MFANCVCRCLAGEGRRGQGGGGGQAGGAHRSAPNRRALEPRVVAARHPAACPACRVGAARNRLIDC